MPKDDLRKELIPGAITALLSEKDSNSYFIRHARMLVFDKPYLLSKKWVRDINIWAEKLMAEIQLDKVNNLPINYPIDIGPLTIIKATIKNRDFMHKHLAKQYNNKMKDYIAIDENGWKYWFRYYNYYLASSAIPAPISGVLLRVGMVVNLESSNIREHKPGISFISSIGKVSEKNK